jgi:hypothetical protein
MTNDKQQDKALRNIALGLACQLPDDPDAAIAVIEYMRKLVAFLNEQDKPKLTVVT